MFNIGDYVFSTRFGIGFIKEKKDNLFSVKYTDGETVENEIDLFKVSDDIISQLVNNRFEDFFSINSINKGREYYLESKVLDLIVVDRNISANVKGNFNYSLSLMVSKNSIRGKCSCPVGTMCKHCAATLYLLKDQYDKLSNSLSDNNLNTNYKEIIDLAISINPNITKIKDLYSIETLHNNLINSIKSKDDLRIFIRELNNYRIETNNYKETKKLVYMIIAFSDLYLFVNDLEPKDIDREIVKTINKFAKFNIRDINRYYFFSNEIIHNVIIYSIVNNAYGYYFEIFRELPDFHINYLIDKCNDSILKSLIEKKQINNIPSNLIRKIYDKSDIVGKKTIAINYHNRFLTGDDLEEFSFNDAIELLNKVNDNDVVIDYILKNYNYIAKYNKNKLYGVCLNLLNGNIRRTQRNSILAMMESDTNARYILEYVNNEDIVIDDINLFKEVFTIKYDIYEKYDYFYEDYLLLIDDNVLFEYKLENGEGKYNNILKAIKEVLKNDKEYTLKYNEIKSKIRDRMLNELKREYLDKINNLDVSFKNNKALCDKAKIKIDYSFRKINEYEKHNESSMCDFYVSFKVSSTGRSYIVKDAYDFLRLIVEGLNYKYGKELEFNHNINNFNNEDKKIIEMLLDCQFDYDAYKDRELPLSERLLENIIEELKGRYVEFEGRNVLVRLDNIPFNPIITDEYILKSGYDKNDIVFGNEKLYLVSDDNIDYIDVNNENNGFVKFVYDSDGMDISIVKDQFVNRVYSRYGSLINVDDRVSKDFKLSELRIDAYFDYVKNSITCETKIYKDDFLLTSDTFLNDVDKSRLAIYLEYLDSLGFINHSILSDDSLMLSFFRMDFKVLKSLCNVYLSDSIMNKKISVFSTPTIRIKQDKSMMEAFVSESEYSDEELYQIMKAIRQKKNFVLLDDDRIVTLDDKNSKEFYEAVNDFRLDLKELKRPKRLEAYEALKAYAHEANCEIDEYLSNMISDISNFKNQEYEMPNINAKLREYQIEGYKWLKTLTKYHLGGILADDMGLGKTLEVITLIKSDMALMPSLIVCPKSLLYNWYSEFNKFDGLTRVIMIYGNSSQRKKIINNINSNAKIVYVTAYDSLRNDLDLYKNYKFNYIVLDEAQAIKNVNAIKSISVKSLVGANRFALTGTPIENNIIDLWSIFDFIMPSFLEDLPIFKSKANGSSYIDNIAKKVSPFILRRTKNEVLKDLPSKYERIISCDMSENQRKIYDAHIKDAQDKLESGSKAFDLLPYLVRLRQICIDPKMFIDNYSSDSGKMIELEEIINEYKNEHKILIFSSFVMALGSVENILKKNNINYYVLTGDTKLEERLRLVNSFNNDDSVRVFLISLKAGGTGLNLIGADTVIHLDPWWNVSAENQASDRAHRIGQTKNVEVIKLVALDSIEERVIELQNLKKDIIDKVIAKDDSSITNLSIDDLKYILE